MKSGSSGKGAGGDPTKRAEVFEKKDQMSLPWMRRSCLRDGDRMDAWIVEMGSGEGDSSREGDWGEWRESEGEAYKESK